MEETPPTVRLADGAPFDVSVRGVTATLLRADIEAARSGAGPAELVLDVRRGQGADVEAHSIAVEWSAADLERLLGEGEAEEVTIAFDRDEMAAVMGAEADVEAHGLREKAIVLTVVAVTGLSTAGVAQARPVAEPTGTATAAVASAPASVQAPAVTTGGAETAGAVDQASPATTVGGAATKAPEVIRAAAPAAAPATTTGGATAAHGPAPSESPATTMGGAGAPPAASNTGGQIGSTGSASSLSTAEEAALAGAAGLVIVAAGFAAASRRRRPVQPA
jgi:pilus assembly protein FimV